ncbi:MAG: hypothetical protein ACT4PJ_04310 [Gemmatimonadaceae bacterium]
MSIVRIKLALVVIALIIWAQGARTEDPWLQGAAIVILLIAFLLRFVGRRRRTEDTEPDEPSTP